MEYKVVGKFTSVNGEGRRAGQLAVFIRFAGCNLDCSYCDTQWANRPDAAFQWISGEDIHRYIQETGIQNVTLTGGEPLIQEGIGELLRLLAADPMLQVEVETNGSVAIEVFTKIGPVSPAFTMDYKLGTSTMEEHMRLENFRFLRQQDTVKFVAGSPKDLETMKALVEEHRLTAQCDVHVSPVFGKLEMDAIVEFMKQHRMNGIRLQPQLHKIIWHPETRGV